MKYYITENSIFKQVDESTYDTWKMANNANITLPNYSKVIDNKEFQIDCTYNGMIDEQEVIAPFILTLFEDKDGGNCEANDEYFETLEAMKNRRLELINQIENSVLI